MNEYENSKQNKPISDRFPNTSEAYIDPSDNPSEPAAPIRFVSKLRKIYKSFGITAKILFTIFAVLAIWSGTSIAKQVYATFTYEVPGYGGSLHEGIVGYASFINPVLEYTDADKDLTSLIYSGLLRYSPSEGKYVGDLAESYEISENLLTYTFKIRPNATFHDAVPVTADDVVFTIEKIKDASVQSPLASNWIGVNVEKIDDMTVSFSLLKPYAPFIENFTVGILPKHRWGNIDPSIFSRSTLNQEPVGSGPYQLVNFEKDASGIYTEYTLQAFKGYTLGRPYIKTLRVSLYPQEQQAVEAYENGDVESIGGLGAGALNTLKDKAGVSEDQIKTKELPYTYMISFNQNSSKVFLSKDVRKALAQAVNRTAIADEILFGLGTPITSPFNHNAIAATSSSASSSVEVATYTLLKAGWKKNTAGIFEKTTEDATTKKKVTETIKFTISTSNLGDLKQITENIVDSWKALGADVSIQVFDDSDFVKKILRPRKFESILYGYAVNRIPDFYPFWHSSQRNDPGLNTAMYTNTKVDKYLETLRAATSTEVQAKTLALLDAEFQNDIPAIAIISPEYPYILPVDVKGFDANMVLPRDRFADIYKWYRSTDRALKISQ